MKIKDLEEAFRYADRRDMLCKQMNLQKGECPVCGTRQLQLTKYMDTIPAEWKCRHCKERFKWEPEI